MTLWTVAPQAPLSMGWSWQESWSGLPFIHSLKFICSPKVSALLQSFTNIPERHRKKNKKKNGVTYHRGPSWGPPRRWLLAKRVARCHFQDTESRHLYLPFSPPPAWWISESLKDGGPTTWKRPESSNQCLKKHHPLMRNVLLGLFLEWEIGIFCAELLRC